LDQAWLLWYLDQVERECCWLIISVDDPAEAVFGIGLYLFSLLVECAYLETTSFKLMMALNSCLGFDADMDFKTIA